MLHTINGDYFKKWRRWILPWRMMTGELQTLAKADLLIPGVADVQTPVSLYLAEQRLRSLIFRYYPIIRWMKRCINCL